MNSGVDFGMIDPNTYENVERLPKGTTEVKLECERRNFFILPVHREGGFLDLQRSEIYVTTDEGRTVRKVVGGYKRGRALRAYSKGQIVEAAA